MTQVGGLHQQAHSAALSAAPAPPVATAETRQVRMFELDGVRCFWAESEGPMTAGLIFGVGMSDERFHERGLTHLIEHMSLHHIDRGIAHNGSVDLTNTSLHCAGPLSDVQQFFRTALDGLNNLPYEELERESRVLAAESARRPQSFAAEALSIMYGFAGPGMVTLPEAGLREVTPERVEAWKRQYFVKENAAAFFHGPMPQGISFAELASGQRAPHSPAQRILQPKVMLHQTNAPGPAIFAPYERSVGSPVIVGIAEDRLTQRLRGEMGVSYDVSTCLTELDPNTLWLTIGADAASTEHTAQTFETMRFEVDRLAQEGPTAEELQFVVGQMDKAQSGELGDPTKGEVVARARFFVEGRPYTEYTDFRAQLFAMTPADFAAPLAKALEAPLWVVPHGTPISDVRLEGIPLWSEQVAEGDTFASKYADLELRASESMVSLCTPTGDGVTMELGKIAGVSTYIDGGVMVHSADGFNITVMPSDFDAEAVVAAFVAKVPADLVVSTGERLRSEEATAGLVPRKTSSSLRGKLKKPRRKPKEAEQAEPANPSKMEQSAPIAPPVDVQPSAPSYESTLGHLGATQMSQAVMDGNWARAEEVWHSTTSDLDKAHMFRAAAKTGGRPDRLDPWVDGSSSPGLALTIRGEMGTNWAWDARTGARSEDVSQEMFQEFWHRLKGAEADLMLATEAMPESSLPWAGLLTTARGLQIPKPEVEERYIRHIERGATLWGHLSFQQFMCNKWFGSHDEMWEHAEFVCDNAPDGATALSVAAMAFVEHWLDVRRDENVQYESGGHFLDAIGRRQYVVKAATKAHRDPSFPVPQPDAATALEIFFTFYVAIEGWRAAASLIAPIGDRFTGFPIAYFTSQPWPVLRDQVVSRAGNLR